VSNPKYVDREQQHPYQVQIERILSQIFSQKRCRIYLFGSRATDTYHDTSDFDIGVLAEEDIRRELSLARERLEQSNIPLSVDLVDLGSASEPFRQAVLTKGILLWIN
jgi:predicted nucleotidyltransferase